MGKIIIKEGLLKERGIGINVPRWENYKDANVCQLTHKPSAISVKTLKIGFCRNGQTERPGRGTGLSRRRHRRRGAVCQGLIPAARAGGIESSASLSRLDSQFAAECVPQSRLGEQQKLRILQMFCRRQRSPSVEDPISPKSVRVISQQLLWVIHQRTEFFSTFWPLNA